MQTNLALVYAKLPLKMDFRKVSCSIFKHNNFFEMFIAFAKFQCVSN